MDHKVILGETFGHAELRFMTDLTHQAYRDASSKEFVRWPVLETLLNISLELLVWQVEHELPEDGYYIKRTFEFTTENWEEEAARFMRQMSCAVDPGYAEYFMRPLASGCFPLPRRTRLWPFGQRETFIREVRTSVREMNDTFTAGDLRVVIRVDGQRGDLRAAVGDEARAYIWF